MHTVRVWCGKTTLSSNATSYLTDAEIATLVASHNEITVEVPLADSTGASNTSTYFNIISGGTFNDNAAISVGWNFGRSIIGVWGAYPFAITEVPTFSLQPIAPLSAGIYAIGYLDGGGDYGIFSKISYDPSLVTKSQYDVVYRVGLGPVARVESRGYTGIFPYSESQTSFTGMVLSLYNGEIVGSIITANETLQRIRQEFNARGKSASYILGTQSDNLNLISDYTQTYWYLYELPEGKWDSSIRYVSKYVKNIPIINTNNVDKYFFCTPLYGKFVGESNRFNFTTPGATDWAPGTTDYIKQYFKAVTGGIFFKVGASSEVYSQAVTFLSNNSDNITTVSGVEGRTYALTSPNSDYYLQWKCAEYGFFIRRKSDNYYMPDGYENIMPSYYSYIQNQGSDGANPAVFISDTYAFDGTSYHNLKVPEMYYISSQNNSRKGFFMSGVVGSPVSGVIYPASPYVEYYELVLGAQSTPPDPYNPDSGGDSGPGGGGGGFDNESDPVPLPPLPTISATDCGFATVYVPSLNDLLALSKYLWSDEFDINTIKKLIDNPFGYLIALNILPFTPDVASAPKNLHFAVFDTHIPMNYILNQYQEILCGSVDVQEYWGSALDYSPNTRSYLYLPYIGTQQIDTDIIMNHTCSITYRIDVYSGTCMAFLLVDGHAIYHWTGQCSSNVPLTGSDYSRVISGLLSVIGTVAAVGASGAVLGLGGAGEALGAIGAGALGAQTTLANGGFGAISQAMGMIATPMQSALQSAAIPATAAIAGTANTVQSVMGAKPMVQFSGSFAGNGGIMGVQKPYLLFIRPRQSLAEDYKHFVGYPSNIYARVSDCSGFTQYEQIELKGITATDTEIAEIANLLKGGFYA